MWATNLSFAVLAERRIMDEQEGRNTCEDVDGKVLLHFMFFAF